jgi:phenylpropionate dioxygenase-like ring-hydroxylating dioxygenase large terminal subunit
VWRALALCIFLFASPLFAKTHFFVVSPCPWDDTREYVIISAHNDEREAEEKVRRLLAGYQPPTRTLSYRIVKFSAPDPILDNRTPVEAPRPPTSLEINYIRYWRNHDGVYRNLLNTKYP